MEEQEKITAKMLNGMEISIPDKEFKVIATGYFLDLRKEWRISSVKRKYFKRTRDEKLYK